MSINNRVYYASQAIQLRPVSASGTGFDYWYHPLAVQSVGMQTKFATEQTFQLGTVEIYDNVENIPEVEVTINKIIDSTAPLYLMCMGGSGGIPAADSQTLVSLSNNRVHFRLGIYGDDKQHITGGAGSSVLCSGMYLSSFNYTFPVDGNATEEVTLVGNNKFWNTGNIPGVQSANFSAGNIFAPDTRIGGINPSATSGVVRRQYLNVFGSTLPTGSGGIRTPNGQATLPHIQNITISANLGRESINQLGKFGPYCRYATFPIEVTSEFGIIAQDGDGMDVDDFKNDVFCGTLKKNLTNKTIILAVCDNDPTNANNTMTFNLGAKNTLTSVNYTGGDTGGGNATISYSFRNFNNFHISASGSYKSGIAFADNGGAVSAQSVALDESGPVAVALDNSEQFALNESEPVSYLDYNSGDNNNV
jgi:hypothetical protein